MGLPLLVSNSALVIFPVPSGLLQPALGQWRLSVFNLCVVFAAQADLLLAGGDAVAALVAGAVVVVVQVDPLVGPAACVPTIVLAGADLP